MKKIYSLVLSEELMQQVDALAAVEGKSRSETVNELLARNFSHETPESRMRSLWDTLERAMIAGSELRFSNLATPSMALLEASLSYPYRPTVRYTVELTPEKPYLGILKITLRSRSGGLLDGLERFFQLWARLENEFQGKRFWQKSEDRYERVLLRPAWDKETQAEQLYAYVAGLNRAINVYFSEGDGGVVRHYENAMTDISI